jgi:hypothetical protein
MIYSYSSIQTIFNVRQVSVQLSREVAFFLSDAYCIDQLLLGFFTTTQIAGFMAVQSHTGTLIAGSVALKFLLRDPSLHHSPLTLYVECIFEVMITDFMKVTGYTLRSDGQDGLHGGITSDWDTAQSGNLLDKVENPSNLV